MHIIRLSWRNQRCIDHLSFCGCWNDFATHYMVSNQGQVWINASTQIHFTILVVSDTYQLNAPKGYGTPSSVVLDQRRVQAQADAATKEVSTLPITHIASRPGIRLPCLREHRFMVFLSITTPYPQLDMGSLSAFATRFPQLIPFYFSALEAAASWTVPIPVQSFLFKCIPSFCK